MKRRKQELDVDFIGGEGSLTKEEEKRITAFLQSRKQKTSTQKHAISNQGGDKRAAGRTKIDQ